MKKNLIVVGNSLGIIIEKPILDLLGISKETKLEMKTDGHRLIIEPIKEESDRAAKIKASTRRVMNNHDKTLRELAK